MPNKPVKHLCSITKDENMRQWKEKIGVQPEEDLNKFSNVLKKFIIHKKQISTEGSKKLYNNEALLRKKKLLLEDILVWHLSASTS